MFREKFPVAKMAELTGDLEERAKKGHKDQLTLWDDEQLVTLSALIEYLCHGKLTHLFQPNVFIDETSYKTIERHNKLALLFDEIRDLKEMYEKVLLATSDEEAKKTESQYAHFLYHTFHGVDFSGTSYHLYKSKNKDVVF